MKEIKENRKSLVVVHQAIFYRALAAAICYGDATVHRAAYKILPKMELTCKSEPNRISDPKMVQKEGNEVSNRGITFSKYGD